MCILQAHPLWEYGNASYNSKSWIKGLFRHLFPAGNRDHHGKTARITEGIRNVLHSFPDHGTRHLVDGSRSYRLFQAFFCHPAHASASVNVHAAFLFLTHRSVDQKAMGGIRVVPAVLYFNSG